MKLSQFIASEEVARRYRVALWAAWILWITDWVLYWLSAKRVRFVDTTLLLDRTTPGALLAGWTAAAIRWRPLASLRWVVANDNGVIRLDLPSRDLYVDCAGPGPDDVALLLHWADTLLHHWSRAVIVGPDAITDITADERERLGRILARPNLVVLGPLRSRSLADSR